MAVITISRQFGAGGRTLGRMIGKKLDYRFLDDLILQEIAKEAKVSKKMVISMERTAGSMLSKMFSGLLSSDYIDRLMGEGKGYMDEEVYVQTLYDVMLKLASEDNVILTGRGGQYILEEYEGAFHILLVANKQDRIKFMQQHYNLSDAKAQSAVLNGERRRTNLYKKFGKKDYNEPIHYDLVLNMSRIPLEKGVELVCSLVGK
ncbi:MAG: cytidylate kinase-like family protein [Desulfobacteraceae bacterium]|jgi:cytidylate kinase|nr:cytidylate kinase-like family protein [Desulfobacteraceae bacterium]